MSRSRSSRRQNPDSVAKPCGVLHPRVQLVGPEHFGIVCFDCAKERSKFLLADFYGKILIPPTEVEHNQPKLEQAVAQIRQAFEEHQLKDGLVAIERTGRYHTIVQRAFDDFEVRIVHPFVTKQYRTPVDPGYKTDDTDLFAIHRATVTGCALKEAELDLASVSFRLLVRHRRDLVRKRAILNCQIRDHLQVAWTGFANCFDKFFDSAIPWHILRQFDSVEQFQKTKLTHLCQSLKEAKIRFQTKTLQTVLDWAQQAPPGDIAASQHQRIALALYDDRQRKTTEIQAAEREIASCLVQTPYVLLLSVPGINVVSAADFAAEMGPIHHYANAKCITGRAGLRPARYQSDQVDRKDGKLVLHCNRSLRAALLNIADNLVLCNHHFRGLTERWKTQGKDPRHSRIKVGSRFSRIAFQMVGGGKVFCHPCTQERHYLLDKLNGFHREHGTEMDQVLADLRAAIEHLPDTEHAKEAVPLQEELERINGGRRHGPQPLADILPIVLAGLGVKVVQSKSSGE